MTCREATARNSEQAIASARAIRAEHAMAAACYANQVEQARATTRYSAMARWTDEYRRSATARRDHPQRA